MVRFFQKLLLTQILLVSFLGTAFSQAEWDAANKAMADGDAAAAQKLYDQIWKNGGAGFALHYNLGAAEYRLGHEGEAIWHFETALLNKPSDADALYNLKVAYAHTRDRMPENASFGAAGSIGKLGTSDFWASSTLGCLFVTLAFSLWGKQLMPEKLKAYFPYKIAVLSLLTLVNFYYAYAQFKAETAGRYAIIMAQEAPLHSAADTSSTILTTFHAGTKVLINDKIGDFCKVHFANGTDGWLPEAQLRKLYRN